MTSTRTAWPSPCVYIIPFHPDNRESSWDGSSSLQMCKLRPRRLGSLYFLRTREWWRQHEGWFLPGSKPGELFLSCAALKEEMSRSMGGTFLFSCRGALLSPWSSVCPLLYGLALLSSSRKPSLITQAHTNPALLWIRVFYELCPTPLGLHCALQSSCLLPLSQRLIQESHARGDVPCVMPPAGPFPRAGEQLLLPGSIKGALPTDAQCCPRSLWKQQG